MNCYSYDLNWLFPGLKLLHSLLFLFWAFQLLGNSPSLNEEEVCFRFWWSIENLWTWSGLIFYIWKLNWELVIWSIWLVENAPLNLLSFEAISWRLSDFWTSLWLGEPLTSKFCFLCSSCGEILAFPPEITGEFIWRPLFASGLIEAYYELFTFESICWLLSLLSFFRFENKPNSVFFLSRLLFYVFCSGPFSKNAISNCTG